MTTGLNDWTIREDQRRTSCYFTKNRWELFVLLLPTIAEWHNNLHTQTSGEIFVSDNVNKGKACTVYWITTLKSCKLAAKLIMFQLRLCQRAGDSTICTHNTYVHFAWSSPKQQDRNFYGVESTWVTKGGSWVDMKLNEVSKNGAMCSGNSANKSWHRWSIWP